jgi:hypothetical protein
MVALKNTNHRIRGSSIHSASDDPFDEAERKTRQANRRYPLWVALMEARMGRSL